MKALRIIKDMVYVCMAIASLYVFAAILLGWPLVEYFTPKTEISKSVTVILHEVEKDSRPSVCAAETEQRIGCPDEIIIGHDDPNDYSKPPLSEQEILGLEETTEN